jgi:hypothetical protein
MCLLLPAYAGLKLVATYIMVRYKRQGCRSLQLGLARHDFDWDFSNELRGVPFLLS